MARNTQVVEEDTEVPVRKSKRSAPVDDGDFNPRPKSEISREKLVTVTVQYSKEDAAYLDDVARQLTNGNRAAFVKQAISHCIGRMVKSGRLESGIPSES